MSVVNEYGFWVRKGRGAVSISWHEGPNGFDDDDPFEVTLGLDEARSLAADLIKAANAQEEFQQRIVDVEETK